MFPAHLFYSVFLLRFFTPFVYSVFLLRFFIAFDVFRVFFTPFIRLHTVAVLSLPRLPLGFEFFCPSGCSPKYSMRCELRPLREQHVRAHYCSLERTCFSCVICVSNFRRAPLFPRTHAASLPPSNTVCYTADLIVTFTLEVYITYLCRKNALPMGFPSDFVSLCDMVVEHPPRAVCRWLGWALKDVGFRKRTLFEAPCAPL